MYIYMFLYIYMTPKKWELTDFDLSFGVYYGVLYTFDYILNIPFYLFKYRIPSGKSTLWHIYLNHSGLRSMILPIAINIYQSHPQNIKHSLTPIWGHTIWVPNNIRGIWSYNSIDSISSTDVLNTLYKLITNLLQIHFTMTISNNINNSNNDNIGIIYCVWIPNYGATCQIIAQVSPKRCLDPKGFTGLSSTCE